MTDVVSLLLLAFGPLAIGLLLGVDRRITARMQNRVGPPLLQPFYDLAKLFRKDRRSTNRTQVSFAVAALLLQMAAWCVFALGGDLLVAFFVSGAGSLALALGAFSVRSAYSQIGAQRELLQMLSYEPILLLALLVLGWQSGTFMADAQDESMLFLLPLVIITFVPVLAIKMQKSPFDLATAHQEIVSGVYVEFAGPYYGLLKLANWFELALVFGFLSLFFWDQNVYVSIVGKSLLAFLFLFVTVLLDNSTARLTREQMVKYALTFGLGLIAVNVLAIIVEAAL
ncbi:MAG: F(420)H(2) dehydrogenase subunit H [Methanomassiliicoccales archaeon PtaU1.Bin124]|nr:MAG: F(420)H(2) dehydrogenase subunit H [Methanomassiliicoccales archaeon PtaU1.Bin124]